jgi:hypothetical protein
VGALHGVVRVRGKGSTRQDAPQRGNVEKVALGLTGRSYVLLHLIPINEIIGEMVGAA